MNMRLLGSSGLKVSELCFGTMTFGGKDVYARIGQQRQEDANRLVSMAMDGGINFFDTADVYSEGLSEEILGAALGGRRKDIVLATKVYGRMGQGVNDVGLTRHHIIRGCEASLKRLRTEYIDLYQAHNWDSLTPLEETLSAFDHLVHSGKVRYIGCSNYAGWHLMKALAISGQHRLEKFITIQLYYSLMTREIEYEVVPVCADQGIGIVAWSPLAGGFLTGKYRRGHPHPPGTRRNPEGNFLEFDQEKGFDIVDELGRIAERNHATISQAAINYLLRKPAVSSVAIGARTPEHLSDLLKATSWQMPEEDVHTLDELSKPPRLYPYWMVDFAKGER